MKYRKTEFIETEECVFLPRPTSVFGGMARHKWFEKLTGKSPHIASPDLWSKLVLENEVRLLVQHDDGQWEIMCEATAE